MKRICLLLLAIAFIMTMTGCRLVNAIKDTAKDQTIMNQRDEKNQQLCESIYNDLKSKNSSELSELFCEKIKNSHDLSSEISQALNCIDGNIVSYESIDLESKGLSLHYIFDTPTNLLCFSTILGVKTDKNNAYKIKVSHCIRFEYDSDYEGVFEIKILKDSQDENNPLCGIGEFLETIVPQQIPDDYVKIDDDAKDSFGYTKTTSENILTALKNHDAEGFNNLFSQEARLENGNLSREINDILDFVDGNLVSYSNFHGGSGGKTMEYGEYTEFEDFVEIYDIMSDSGEMYEIEYDAYYVNKAEPSKQGICTLVIKHVNSANTEIFHGGHEVIDEILIE